MAADVTTAACTTIAAGCALIAAGLDPASLGWAAGGALTGIAFVEAGDRWRSIWLLVAGAPVGALASELAHAHADAAGPARWAVAFGASLLAPGILRALVRTVGGRAPSVIEAGIDRLLAVLRGPQR